MWWKEMHIPVYLYLSETSINFVHLHTFAWLRSTLCSRSTARFVVIFSFSIQLRSSLTFGWVFSPTHSLPISGDFSVFFHFGRCVCGCRVLAFMLSAPFTYVFTVSNTLVPLHRKARKQLGKLCSCSVKIKRSRDEENRIENERRWRCSRLCDSKRQRSNEQFLWFDLKSHHIDKIAGRKNRIDCSTTQALCTQWCGWRELQDQCMNGKNGAQSSAEVYKCSSGIHLTHCRNVHFGQGVVNNRSQLDRNISTNVWAEIQNVFAEFYSFFPSLP